MLFVKKGNLVGGFILVFPPLSGNKYVILIDVVAICSYTVTTRLVVGVQQSRQSEVKIKGRF